MRDLKVVLTIPQYRVHKAKRASWLDEVGRFTSSSRADLVVFPEGFLSRYYGTGTLEAGQTLVAEIARRLHAAVLAGFQASNGFELALYFNPKPQSGETSSHLQYKHVVSNRVAFELPDWAERVGQMLRPISLKGFKIGCLNCYEMFVPLIVDALEKSGADAYIDLTGDNVPPGMWKTVVGGRSIETHAPFLCTMGYFRTWPGKAISLAYDRGKAIYMQRPDGSLSIESGEPATFSLVSLPASDSGPEISESYPKSWGEDITVSLGTLKPADVEVEIVPGGYRVLSHGRSVTTKYGTWTKLTSRDSQVAFLSLSIEDLAQRRVLLERLPSDSGQKEPVKHLVMYYGKSTGGLSDREISTLASLRALEHSIAVLVMAGDSRRVYRQSRARTAIQVQERDGLFGIKANGTNNLQGPSFPEECATYKTQYLSLLAR